MMRKTNWTLRAVCVLAALLWAGTAGAQGTFSLDSGSGGQSQIGNGLPIPIQDATTAGNGMGAPIGTGTVFPPLLIPGTGATVTQTGSAPLTLSVPAGALKRVPSGPLTLGVSLNNPTVFQVRTELSFTNIGGTLMAGGRTGATTATFTGVPGSSSIRYVAGANQFGGPGQSFVNVASETLVWAHSPGVVPPCKHPAFGGASTPNNEGCVSQLLAAFPAATAAVGGTVSFQNSTPGTPTPMSPNVVLVSVPNSTGLINLTFSYLMTGTATNMATSAGFPWTTGMITLSQPNAQGGAEVFTLTGSDNRTSMGSGTLSLVSGALSARTLSGANANRGWQRYVLVPEPGAMLAAGAALAALGVCHGLVRRRSR